MGKGRQPKEAASLRGSLLLLTGPTLCRVPSEHVWNKTENLLLMIEI